MGAALLLLALVVAAARPKPPAATVAKFAGPEMVAGRIFRSRPKHLERDGLTLVPLNRTYTPPGGTEGYQPDPFRFREYHESIEQAFRAPTIEDPGILRALERAREIGAQRFTDRYVIGFLDGGELVLAVLAAKVPGLTLPAAVECPWETAPPNAADYGWAVHREGAIAWTGGRPSQWSQVLGLPCAGSDYRPGFSAVPIDLGSAVEKRDT